jgi:beta-glucosidase-like glycosyl hydrolase
MSTPFADLVLPAIRWDPDRGYEPARPDIERALAAGVGGFVLFGGERGAMRTLTRDLQSAAADRLLIASDIERGAGQQVRGLTPLPPLLALAAMGEAAVREAARLTAREARDVGITWALAPVCDLDIEPQNPIVQTRSLGTDAFEVAELAAAWIQDCQDEGVLACAKHFPGHGRTTLDSHATLPVVDAGRELERDLMPFRRAVASGVAAVMTAHVAFPAWDSAGVPATHSHLLLHELLRRDLFHAGLVVTDALIMEGALAAGAGEGAVRALLAGCDLLCYPKDLDAVLAAVGEAAAAGRGGLADHAARSSLRRAEAAARAAEPQALGSVELAAHRQRGIELCTASVKLLRGDMPRLRGAVRLEIVDDDAGGPYPLPPRTAFGDELRRLGLETRENGEPVVLLFADVKSWKGRAGLAAHSVEQLTRLLGPKTPVVLFGHPRRQLDVPHLGPILCAWSGDEGMQRAAARRLAEAAR